jgi:hypothetical protein
VFVPPSYCETEVLKEQRVCIKFCQKLGKTATETYEMLQQAFGETALSRSKTFEWYSRFKNGRTPIDDDPHTGRSSAARTNKTVHLVNAVIRGNRHLTIREIADELSLSFGTCQAILMQDLGMRRVLAKLVPRLLTQDQTEHRAANCCNVPKLTPPSCQALSQGMNHGFMATTLSQNKCRHNGRRCCHFGQRKRGKSGQMSRQC